MNFEHAHISTGEAKGTVLKGTHYNAVLEYNPLFMRNLVQITKDFFFQRRREEPPTLIYEINALVW